MLLSRIESGKKLMCKLAHMVHGFIAGFLAIEKLSLSVFMYFQFLLYEAVEWKVKKDRMYPELCEWSIGFVLGLLARLFALRTILAQTHSSP